MTLIISVLAISLLLYASWRALPINFRGNKPDQLEFDQECISLGVIPERLSWAIPKDYAVREDWTMASHIEPTFVSETHAPKWAHVITLTNPKETQVLTVVYDLDGNLSEL